jgi:DsbC/DsbD-like thiol-disulfide interchange protein
MVTSVLRQCVSVAQRTNILAAILGGLLASAPVFNAFAADASAWDGDTRSAIRLVAGSRPADGSLRAGIELRLADGWKTYWRYPGDSGVPPVFDFSKSENVKSYSVLWPAPHRFTYEGGASIGYKGDVMFPLHVVPNDPSRPATLRLSLDYAVCLNICIPARGRAELVLASGPSSHDSSLAAAEAFTPKPARVGDRAPLGIAAVRREEGNSHSRVIVEVIAPASSPLDLFAEGPTADWALPLPEPVAGAPPGLRWFAFDLDGAPPGVDDTGAPLRFTVVSGENAVEVTAVPK